MQSFFYSIYKYILCSHIWNIVNIFFCYHLCSRFFKFVNKYFYIVVYIIVFLFCFPNHLCSRFIYIIKSGVAKKNKNGESTYISLQKQFCHTASLRSASRPFGASRGLLTRPIFLAVYINQSHTTMQKHFSFLFLTSIKLFFKTQS
jgi:hypothetical protein